MNAAMKQSGNRRKKTRKSRLANMETRKNKKHTETFFLIIKAHMAKKIKYKSLCMFKYI